MMETKSPLLIVNETPRRADVTVAFVDIIFFKIFNLDHSFACITAVFNPMLMTCSPSVTPDAISTLPFWSWMPSVTGTCVSAPF